MTTHKALSPIQVRTIDQICDRFEAELKTCDDARIESFLDSADGIPREILLRELLALELTYRSRNGEPFDEEDYLSRFPNDVPLIQSVHHNARRDMTSSYVPGVETAKEWRSRPVELGDYTLLEEIGRGGMGVVYKARQKSLNRIVAIKLILTGYLTSEEAVVRFYKEARAAAKLNHPGIVSVVDVGEHDGHHFLSMGIVDGDSLQESIQAGPLPPHDAARIIRHVAEAVEFAHQQGIIHRDLKPSNILLNSSGRPMVSDFGLAKEVHAESVLTTTGQVLGTPSYMPPEQALGQMQPTNHSVDIYTLGATLYCLLTGRPPFQSASAVETLKQVIEDEPVPPSRLNSSVPRDLDLICLRCLEKDHRLRFESAQELADDLGRSLEGEAIQSGRFSAWQSVLLLFNRNKKLVAFSAIAREQFVHGAGFTAGNLAVFALTRYRGPEWLIWISFFLPYAVFFTVLKRNRRDHDRSASIVERQMLSIWIGHLFATIALFVSYRISSGPDYIAGILRGYPAMCAVTGLAFYVMGAVYWGRYYLFAIIWMLLAVLASVAPAWAPLETAVLVAISSSATGLYLCRVASETKKNGDHTGRYSTSRQSVRVKQRKAKKSGDLIDF